MRYIYEVMDRPNEAIVMLFDNNEKKDKEEEVFKIINKRWENQLSWPLRVANYYLNHQFFYSNLEGYHDKKTKEGFYKVLIKLVLDEE